MARRRGHFHEDSPGVWRIVASYKDAGGQWRRKWQTVRGSRRDAEEALTALLSELDTGRAATGERRTVSSLMAEWVESKRRTCGLKTLREYVQKTHSYIDSQPFGALPAAKVSPLLLERYYGQLLERGGRGGRPLSGRTVHHVHSHIRDAFALAVKRGHLRVNPADLVEPPRPGDYEGQAFTASEFRAVLRAVEGSKLAAAVFLAAGCGLRRGEVLALTWAEVDLDAGTVEIKRSVDDRGRLKEPKTKRSRRVLPLPSFAARALAVIRGEQAERRLAMGKAYDPAGWVCADEVGRMLRPDYVSVWFPRLCEREGIRRLRFHDLRHTHSTLLAQAGHSMQLVAARMGHSTIATTANIYSHLAASEDRAAADVLDRIIQEGLT